MKHYTLFILCSLLMITACKTEKKQDKKTVEKKLSILEKIAHANGYEHWKNVESIKFTFNVDRDSSHFERTWLWKPKANDVVFMTSEDTVSYNRKAIDSTIAKTDAAFINDKYWLLTPYQLIWDQKSFSYEHTETTEAPLSKKNMQKLTIVYAGEGGYTPGDAYDFYFGNDYYIKEWAYRKGNQPEPNMVTSWEDYKTIGNLHLATMHKMLDGNFQLYFTGIEIE